LALLCGFDRRGTAENRPIGLSEQLFALSDLGSVARKAPTLAKFTAQRRRELQPQTPAPQRKHVNVGVVTNRDVDERMQERPA
jgi:hypothetical protein